MESKIRNHAQVYENVFRNQSNIYFLFFCIHSLIFKDLIQSSEHLMIKLASSSYFKTKIRRSHNCLQNPSLKPLCCVQKFSYVLSRWFTGSPKEVLIAPWAHRLMSQVFNFDKLTSQPTNKCAFVLFFEIDSREDIIYFKRCKNGKVWEICSSHFLFGRIIVCFSYDLSFCYVFIISYLFETS